MTIIDRLAGGLIVSCQAYPGEPMRQPAIMASVAQAAVAGGAVAIRAQGVADVEHISRSVDVPVIGLWKDGEEGVLITPTLHHALAIAAAGADVVAIDGTRRPRPDGRTLAETIAAIHTGSDALVMADCGSLDDAVAAEQGGADIIGTTLAGYSGERPSLPGPDLELVDELLAAVRTPVVVEGRIHTVEQARAAADRGAHAVCVGTAISHPTTITGWFHDAVAPG